MPRPVYALLGPSDAEFGVDPPTTGELHPRVNLTENAQTAEVPAFAGSFQLRCRLMGSNRASFGVVSGAHS